MIEVLTAYLEPYEPAGTFNDDSDILCSTDIIVNELTGAVDLDVNPVAEFMATQGFHYHCRPDGGIHGWILRPKR